MSMISNWTTWWQHSHIYEDDAGAAGTCGCASSCSRHWYDNTENNPNNPDPEQWVYRGSRTTDEMSHAWIAVTHLDQEGYERLKAEREAKHARRGGRGAAVGRQESYRDRSTGRQARRAGFGERPTWSRYDPVSVTRCSFHDGEQGGPAASVTVMLVAPLGAQDGRPQWPSAPRERGVVAEGLPVSPFFEGWYENPDGTYTLSFGYFQSQPGRSADPAGRAGQLHFAGRIRRWSADGVHVGTRHGGLHGAGAGRVRAQQRPGRLDPAQPGGARPMRSPPRSAWRRIAFTTSRWRWGSLPPNAQARGGRTSALEPHDDRWRPPAGPVVVRG